MHVVIRIGSLTLDLVRCSETRTRMHISSFRKQLSILFQWYGCEIKGVTDGFISYTVTLSVWTMKDLTGLNRLQV